MPVRSLLDLIATRAHRHGELPAIAAPGRLSLSYAELAVHVARIGTQLRALGVARTDRVAIVVENGPEMATAFLAIANCAVAAPLNPSYRAAEFEFYLDDLDAKALIVSDELDTEAVAVAATRGIAVIRLNVPDEAAAGVFRLSPEDSREPVREDGDAHCDDVALVLHTSGTTSRPKIVPLTHQNLCVSAGNVCETLDLSPDDACLNVMPLFHIHGLVAGLLATLHGGGRAICTSGFDAPRFFGWIESERPTWYTAVPTMHQSIISRAGEHAATIAACPLRFVRSSSSALPPRVMAELEALFSAPVVEAYGMTEAAHQMCCNPLPPAERKPGSVGQAAGPEVQVLLDGVIQPPHSVGEVLISGDNVTPGYGAGDGDGINRDAFHGDWFRTGDQGYLDCDGYLFLTGRLKEIINRGGETIAPREIDEALMDHPDVHQAVAFAVPDDRLGEDVAAAVVLHESGTVDATGLRAFAAQRLAMHKLPRTIVFLSEIPKGPTGKLQRIGLAEKLGVDGAGASQLSSAQTECLLAQPITSTEERVAAVWCDVLGLDTVERLGRFFEIGGDSILAARVIARLDALGLPATSMLLFFEFPTLVEFAAALHERLNTDSDIESLLEELGDLTPGVAAALLQQNQLQETDDSSS